VSRLYVAPIVEGHGENEAIRVLLERLWHQLGGEYIGVLRPLRHPKSQLIHRSTTLNRAVDLAARKLASFSGRHLVLILLDADTDAPCILGPDLLNRARNARSDVDITCVLANVEYETWFIAAAESLSEYLNVPHQFPLAPEDVRCGKGWVEKHFKGARYSETLDQPAMTAAMDLTLCRNRCPSFDKLCRELESRIKASDH
jgi:hypothetical protein